VNLEISSSGQAAAYFTNSGMMAWWRDGMMVKQDQNHKRRRKETHRVKIEDVVIGSHRLVGWQMLLG